MTTTVAKSGATRRAAAPRSHRTRHLPLMLAGVILTLGVTALGTRLAADRTAGRSAKAVATATAVPAWNPPASSWLRRLEVIQLERQLVRAGYSIKVDGSLDPVTKSALADYPQLGPTHTLSPFLASALEGTVITGRRDPGAWNSRFGLERATKYVERPLTGPGGQLDAKGNLRVP